MSKKNLSIFYLFACLCLLSTSLNAQEQLTIATYYPSPYGSYNELTVANRQAIGDVNGDGQVNQNDMAVDNLGGSIPGSLTIAGSVGIGTTTPQSPAPNGNTTGNLDVNDAYLRSINKWASQNTGVASALSPSLGPGTNLSWNFTTSQTGTAIFIAKGDDPGSIAGVNNFRFLLNGNILDTGWRSVANNHGGSRSFTLIGTSPVTSGTNYTAQVTADLQDVYNVRILLLII